MRFFETRPFLSLSLLMLALALVFMGRALFPPAGQVLGGYDMVGYYHLWHAVAREAILSGRLPLWTAELFNGYPIAVDPQMGLFYPPAWLAVLLPSNVGASWYMVAHIWLAGAGMLAFVRAMGANWTGALLAGLTFAFSGLLAGRLWAGHSTVYAVDAWTPWLLLGLLWSVRRGGWATAGLAGVPLGMALLAGHIPSMLYVGLIWGLFALYLFLTGERRWLVVRQMAIATAVGLALAAVQLVPFVQFTLGSSRVATADFQFVTDYSLPPAHLITLLIPDYFGEPLRAGYWSVPTFEELSYYAGILPLLALALALRRPNRLTTFYVAMIALGLLLAFGRYGFLYRIFYDWLPPFRVVRAPGRATFLYLFAACGLIGQAVTVWRGRAEVGRLMRWLLPALAVVLAAGLAATGAVFASQHPTETSGRLWHQIGGWALALGLVVAGGLLLWGYLAAQDARRRRWLAAGLAALVAADLWLFAGAMVRLEPVEIDPLWAEARAIIGDTPARVLPWGVSVFVQNGAEQVGLHSIFGYSSMEVDSLLALAGSVPDPRSSAYDVLGARYVIAPVRLDNFESGERPLTLLEERNGTWIYERGRVLPVARLVYDVEVIPDGGAAIARVHDPAFAVETTAILDAPPPCAVGPELANPGAADVIELDDGYWRIETSSDAPALLVLAETAYPGWRVTVDGRPAESLTAFTALRAVCVPAGQHLVEWTFAPTAHLWGGLVSLLGVGAVLAAVHRLSTERRRAQLRKGGRD